MATYSRYGINERPYKESDTLRRKFWEVVALEANDPNIADECAEKLLQAVQVHINNTGSHL